MAVSADHTRKLVDSASRRSDPSRLADAAIVALIVANVLAVILESVEAYAIRYQAEFFYFEAFSVAVFSVEYALRLWRSAADTADWREAIAARLRYASSFQGVVDLLAIVPFYLSMFLTIDLRFLRALRLVRLLKLTRYSPAMTLLFRAIGREQEAMRAAVFLLAIALVVAACGIYFCERAAQPGAFGSIPAAIWWAVATLTTVGYGDVTPITIGGKMFGALVMIVGVGMVALPTGILASTFADELRRRREDFFEEAGQAWDDGTLSPDELASLEALRERSGLAADEAERLLREAARQRIGAGAMCPRCGYRSGSGR